MEKVAVITGASAGVGLAAATSLALEGWRVIGVGRDPARTTAAEVTLRAAAPGADITMLRGDLALMADAVRLADEITALTTRLLPLLLRAAAQSPAGTVRVINTSSNGSEMIPGLNWDNLLVPLTQSPGAAYCCGKLANVIFAHTLAQRYGAEGIMALSFHPGTVASNFFSHMPEATARQTALENKITPEQGAETLLWLVGQPADALDNGGYYYCCAPREPNPTAFDPDNGDRLWRLSEELVAGALAR